MSPGSSTADVSFAPLGARGGQEDIYLVGASAEALSGVGNETKALLRVYYAYDADLTGALARAITAMCAAILACSLLLRARAREPPG